MVVGKTKKEKKHHFQFPTNSSHNSVLGLGDLGINGMAISIGKLSLYVAAGGFDPQFTLPIVIDVGTDNAQLRADPNYVGLRQPRVDEQEYYEVCCLLLCLLFFFKKKTVIVNFNKFRKKKNNF